MFGYRTSFRPRALRPRADKLGNRKICLYLVLDPLWLLYLEAPIHNSMIEVTEFPVYYVVGLLETARAVQRSGKLS